MCLASLVGRHKPVDVEDQSHPAIAEDGGARQPAALLEGVPQAFDDHFLLPDQPVHQEAAVLVTGFNHDDD